jgi:hypothetical protein
MNWLPDSREMGRLELVETYFYYDLPCLFSCRNELGHHFLGLLVDHEESEVWVYAAVSDPRLDRIRTGQIDLATAFSQTETGDVFRVTRERGEWLVERVACADLENDVFPLPETRLQLGPLVSQPPSHAQLVALAKQLRADALTLRLKFRNFAGFMAPARPLGKLLTALQNTLNAVAQAIDGAEVKGAGAIPRRFNLDLAVTGVFPSSFGIQLQTTTGPNLLGEWHGSDVIDKFLQLVESAPEDEKLRAQLVVVKRRSANGLRLLMEEFQKEATDLTIDWASPIDGRGREVHLTVLAAKNAIEVINRMEPQQDLEFEVTGVLVGMNARTKVYEFQEDETQRRFVGRIAEDAGDHVVRSTLQQRYSAVIREHAEVGPSGEQEIKYHLIDLAAE